MQIQPGILIALQALGSNKLQTALTMTGITIGVATVLTMISLGSGAESAIEEQVRAAGMNMIIVTAGNYKNKTADDLGAVEEQAHLESPGAWEPAAWNPANSPFLLRVDHPEDDPMEKHDHPTSSQRLGDAEAGLGSAATLTPGDAAAIRGISGVQYVSEGLHENAHVSAGDKRWFTRLHGDNVALPKMRRAWVFQHGRFYTAREESKAEQVIVLGAVAAQKLFGEANPVGQKVSVWKQSWEVVGVVGSGSWMVNAAAGDDQFDAVYIPFTTVQRLLNLSRLNDITVTTASSGDVTRISKEISKVLRERHRISFKSPDDFTVTSQARKALAQGGMRSEVAASVVGNMAGLEKVTLEQLGKTLDRASKTMTALLASVAAVSLLVGGIGIMNIMLLSVTQRTREIGIRRAVGARAGDVLQQFLTEAVALSALGGLAGVMLGIVAAYLISSLVQWTVSISLVSVLISFSIAASIGIFFGYYPAREASRVAPMESLRYE